MTTAANSAHRLYISSRVQRSTSNLVPSGSSGPGLLLTYGFILLRLLVTRSTKAVRTVQLVCACAYTVSIQYRECQLSRVSVAPHACGLWWPRDTV